MHVLLTSALRKPYKRMSFGSTSSLSSTSSPETNHQLPKRAVLATMRSGELKNNTVLGFLMTSYTTTEKPFPFTSSSHTSTTLSLSTHTDHTKRRALLIHERLRVRKSTRSTPMTSLPGTKYEIYETPCSHLLTLFCTYTSPGLCFHQKGEQD
jgi:hypothetical protein